MSRPACCESAFTSAIDLLSQFAQCPFNTPSSVIYPFLRLMPNFLLLSKALPQSYLVICLIHKSHMLHRTLKSDMMLGETGNS